MREVFALGVFQSADCVAIALGGFGSAEVDYQTGVESEVVELVDALFNLCRGHFVLCCVEDNILL